MNKKPTKPKWDIPTIEVPIEWFNKLLSLKNFLDQNGDDSYNTNYNLLMGHIESIEALLPQKAKKKKR